ncbi:MAG TPA: AbrB/MazE/SpoVT family DNA-binding domain-containing protein [Rhizomicrobium sp.]|jgi:antitoxin VapB|nr:AbrB/MazE/SpoVT family DNA-binding domain-containing protein [Rhizomicrobium sp.]
MARTRAFKSGNSQAVRIPADIAFADTDAELEIKRTGDVITIYPVPRGGLKEAVEILRRMPVPDEVEKLERIETRTTLDD